MVTLTIRSVSDSSTASISGELLDIVKGNRVAIEVSNIVLSQALWAVNVKSKVPTVVSNSVVVFWVERILRKYEFFIIVPKLSSGLYSSAIFLTR